MVSVIARTDRPPQPWPARTAAGFFRTRWLARAPIWLYRARLGFVFGNRVLMLEHLGRRTGARRYVVLEVLGRPQVGTWVVAAGLGDRAQWFRNVQANSDVRISVGRHQFRPAHARVLSPDEAAAVLQAFASRHPHEWQWLVPVFEEWAGRPVTEMPLVRLEIAALSSNRCRR